MLRQSAHIKLFDALMLTSLTLFSGSAFAQSRANQPDSEQKEVARAQGSRSSDEAAAPEPRPNDLLSEVTALKAENAVVRELLLKMEEQQKVLLEQVGRLQRRLDGDTTAVVQPGAQATPPAPVGKQEKEDHYRDGVIVWENPEDSKVPFLLKFNNNTQIRYLNTLDSHDTFTDHLGVVRDVHTRNDITVNRAMFILGGYVFDPRLRYSFTVWTSAGAASIVVAGNIGWQFSKALAITGGYTGVPGSRSLVATFPFYSAIDRSMADNFFRPGFTQGVWANGELSKGLNYLVFVGNGLNTLNISANKIDTHLLGSGSLWWEPMGPYGEPGKARNMYDDYYSSRKTRIRLGTSYTRSREDRFSNLDQSSPENTSLYNSDGVLTFSTGAFAPGVTVDQATYRMWAIDGGLKRSGFSVNAQYFFRWLNDFEADGLLPFESMLDHGFELTAGHFVVPRKVQLHARASGVFGEFRDSSEYGGGVKWYFLPTERIWITAEMIKVDDVPYSGAFTPYTAGMNGWTPMIQTVLAF